MLISSPWHLRCIDVATWSGGPWLEELGVKKRCQKDVVKRYKAVHSSRNAGGYGGEEKIALPIFSGTLIKKSRTHRATVSARTLS